MRVLSWFGGIVLVLIMSGGAAAALRPSNETPHTLTAYDPPAAAISASSGVNARAFRHLQPGPGSTRAAAPPPQAVPAPVPAAPAIVVGSTQQALINKDRASAGLAPLTWSPCLYNVAASNAGRMAAQGYISHTNGPNIDLSCRLGYQAGENVGWWSGGVDDPQLNSMFWASADHRANILGPYHYVATAWVVAPNGYAYIAVEFG